MFSVPLKIFQFMSFSRHFFTMSTFWWFCYYSYNFPGLFKTDVNDSIAWWPLPSSPWTIYPCTYFNNLIPKHLFINIWVDLTNRYHFMLTPFSFRLFSRSSSITSVKTLVCLLQEVGCTGRCKFIKRSIFCCGMSISSQMHGKN